MSMRCGQIDATGTHRCVLTPHDTKRSHVYQGDKDWEWDSDKGQPRTLPIERLEYLEAKVEANRLSLDTVYETLVDRVPLKDHQELHNKVKHLRDKVLALINERDKWQKAASYGWNREAEAVNNLEKALNLLQLPITDKDIEARGLIKYTLNTLSVINQPEDNK